MSWPRTGTTILDRYVLGAQIGLGGMSEVYHAIDTVGNRAAAVKLLSPAFANDARARAMARREAWVIQQVRHPTVPKFYDQGDVLLAEGVVVPCTVMEVLTGVMLTDRLGRGPLPWLEAVRFTATIADAVAVAHRRGIVHRDLTPQNLMITEGGVRIIDFGLAGTIAPGAGPRSRSDPASRTRPAGRRGPRGEQASRRGEQASWRGEQASWRGLRGESAPPAEISPPVVVPDDVMPEGAPPVQGDPADDVYSLGVLLYQMLTGRSPYPTTRSGEQLAAARLRHAAPTPVLAIPGMPRAVADICRSCMAKRPEERPDSVTVSLALWSTLVPEGH